MIDEAKVARLRAEVAGRAAQEEQRSADHWAKRAQHARKIKTECHKRKDWQGGAHWEVVAVEHDKRAELALRRAATWEAIGKGSALAWMRGLGDDKIRREMARHPMPEGGA